jgi:hypothetical protein
VTLRFAAGIFVAAAASVAVAAQSRPASTTRTGTIIGRVHFTGRPPGNPVIRMGMDPKCADLIRGRQVIQEQAMVSADGGVGNVFVRLEGSFPATPVPSAPVVVYQRSCIYGPRVVGMRVGQRLVVRNDDDLMHNVHSSSSSGNSFNVGQPKAGIVYEYTPKTAEVMLKLGCDVHRWMVAFVGVLPHPYFAVTGGDGRYTIAQVPAGTVTIKSWHEQFGELTKSVAVRAGASTTIDFEYSAAGR